jgi:esterase/lipase superfamily enzyme
LDAIFNSCIALKEHHYHWHSALLDKAMDMLVFGDKGRPLIIFPTSMGSYTQNKDFYLVESVSWFINEGFFKVYTPASIDMDSWYNKNIPPAYRARNHEWYDRFILDEVVVPALKDTGYAKAAFAGCSFGAYHAVNFAWRHPELASHIISMGGAFDIKPQLDGYYDDAVYYNNPPDYLPGLGDPRIKDIAMIFGTGSDDICKGANISISALLEKKGIPHKLDIVKGAGHDWPVWREMFPRYLNDILHQGRTAVKYK